MRIPKALLAILTAAIILPSCKSNDASNMQYTEQMKDSIFKNYPTVNSITIEVKTSSILKVTLGDKHLFNATDADRQKTANEIGMMALRIFPTDNDLDQGQLLVSDDEKNVQIDEAKAKKTDIKMDSLRRIVYGK